MRVFVTGASGFIGSAVVKELIAADHHVLGLCRSEDKAAALAAVGAEVHRGSIEDLNSIREGAACSDGVIHLAFNHDFSKYKANCESDRRVIEALGSTLAGSSRPLIVTSGTAMANTVPGRPATEDGAVVGSEVIPRAASEEAATALGAGRNVPCRCGRGRLPPGHGRGDRPASGNTCQIHSAGRGSGLFRLARGVRGARPVRIERADTQEAGMAADRAGNDL